MYSIIVSEKILCIVDNVGIMSFYTSKYGSIFDEEPNKSKTENKSDKAKGEEKKADSESIQASIN